MVAGYSGTPLARKLGIKPGHRVAVLDGPPELVDLLGELPEGTVLQAALEPAPDVVLAFNTDRQALEAQLSALEEAIFPDRALWLAWPKKASGVSTDLTGDVVRAAILATRMVDVKVCAISEVWSGLKAVWRKEHRTG